MVFQYRLSPQHSHDIGNVVASIAQFKQVDSAVSQPAVDGIAITRVQPLQILIRVSGW